MTNTIKEFRDGIFALRTRRPGTVGELMIEALYKFTKSQNQFHDRYDAVTNSRIEVKFSTVMKANESPITADNLISQVNEANVGNRAMKSTELSHFKFDSNIQQVKCSEFDLLYYGLFLADKIAIFKCNSHEVPNIPGYSNRQHKGNEGEGQFHLNNRSIDWHFRNKFVQWLSYEELYNLFNDN